MNTKRYVLSALSAFVFMIVFNFVWHEWLLRGQYEATMAVWRPEAEMQALFPWMVVAYLALAFVIAFLFTRHYESRGIGEGLRFGLYVGLCMGLLQFSSYVFLPIPFVLAVLWLVGSIISGLGIGIVLALVYRRNGAAAASSA